MKSLVLMAGVILASDRGVSAQDAELSSSELSALSLEELMNVSVRSPAAITHRRMAYDEGNSRPSPHRVRFIREEREAGLTVGYSL